MISNPTFRSHLEHKTRECKIFILSHLDHGTLNRSKPKALASLIDTVGNNVGYDKATDLLKKLDPRPLFELTIWSNEVNDRNRAIYNDYLHFAFPKIISILNAFEFAPYVMSQLTANMSKSILPYKIFDWGKQLKEKVLQLSKKEIANSTDNDWDMVWKAFQDLVDRNELSADEMAFYRLGIHHKIIKAVNTPQQLKQKHRSEYEAFNLVSN